MTGQARWVFLDSEQYAELVADGWTESRVWRLVQGEHHTVLMVKTDSAASAGSTGGGYRPKLEKDLSVEWRNDPSPGGAEDTGIFD